MRKEFLLLTGASFLWATSFPFIKYSYSTLGPASLLLARFAISTVLIVLYCLVFHIRLPFLSKEALLLGLTNAGGFLFQFYGQLYTTASAAPLLLHTNLVIVALLGWIMLGERLSKRIVAAVLLALAGVAVLTTKLNPSFSFSSAKGELMLLAAALSWAFFIVFSRKFRASSSPAFTLSVLLWTFLFLLPLAPFADVSSSELLVKGGYLALFCTLIPYLLYFEAVKGLRAVEVNIVLTSEIFFAVVLSVIFLSEKIKAYLLVGGGLILAALYLLFSEEKLSYHNQKEEG